MMKRLALTGLFLIFLCGCAFAMESTNTAADKNDVITIDLAKEPISEASSPDSTEADSPAYKQADNAITAIEVANEFVNITAAKPFKYKVMDKDNQFIKKIDLIGVSAGRFENVILPGSAKVADVTLKPADGHVVVVVTLASAASIKANYSDNTLSLVFNKPEAAVSHPAPAPLPEPKKGHGKNITGVAFYKDSDNAARLEIAADGLISSDVFTLDGRVVVDVHDIKMSAVVPKDIAPPLNAVRWAQYKNKVRIVMDLSGNATHKVDQQGDKLTVLLSGGASTVSAAPPVSKEQPAAAAPLKEQPPVVEAAPQPEPETAKNNTVTLNYNNVEIVAVLKLIAYVSGYNVVVDPRVNNKVTVHVNDMPWDKALDLIIESNKLKKTVEANVIKISPAVAPEPGVSSRAAQTPSVHMNDVTITFKGADGEIMTIRRANSAAGSGLICVDVNSTEASSSASQQNFTPSLNSGSKKADKR